MPAWVFASALVAIGLLAFGGAVRLPFVFDDHGSIVENPYITQLAHPLQAMRAPVQSAFAGRPVASLTLAANYALGGLDPAAFHVWNIGLHLLCGLLLFAILRRTLALPHLAARFGHAADALAFVCAVTWVVHPLQTELVDYVTQRTESTMALCYLATLYAAIRAMSRSETHPGRWEILAILACLLGAGSKESMVTAPIMVLLYDAVFVAGSGASALRSRPRLYGGLVLSWVIIGAIVASGPRWRSAGFSSGISPWTYLLNQPELLVRYLRLTVWPTGQVFDYGLPREVTLADVWPFAVILIALLAATVAAWRGRRELAFLGTWFFVTLAPTSSIVPIATEVGAERRMYLPLIPLVFVSVIGVHWLIDRLASTAAARRTVLQALCAGAVAAILIALTIHRNAEYATEARLWQTVLERRPQGRAHYSYALELRQLGRRDEAIAHFEAALADTPEAHYALALELETAGRHEQAVAHYEAFLAAKPDDVNAPLAHVMLGRALNAAGHFDRAREQFAEALRMRPANSEARSGMAESWFREGRYDEAIAAYQEIVSHGQPTARAYTNLGIALVGRNRDADAVNAFARAVELTPDDAGLRSNLGNSLASVGRLDAAAAEYRHAIALKAHEASAYFGLGMVLRAQGRLDEAEDALRQAVHLDPRNDDARAGLAQVVAERRTTASH